MYGKIFTSMYDGTLADNWEALVTFQQLIVLSDPEGFIDMTPAAIARRTGIPKEIIIKGLTLLEKEDKHSRTHNENGRRIGLIDAHKPWGWYIVNHNKYRNIAKAETVREQTRKRVQNHRAQKVISNKNNSLKKCNAVGNAEKRKKDYTDTYTDTNTKKKTTKKESVKKFIYKGIDFNDHDHRITLDIMKEFIDYRIKVKRPLSQEAYKRALIQCIKTAKELNMDVDDIITESMDAGWIGIGKPNWIRKRLNMSEPRKPFKEQNYKSTKLEDIPWMK